MDRSGVRLGGPRVRLIPLFDARLVDVKSTGQGIDGGHAHHHCDSELDGQNSLSLA